MWLYNGVLFQFYIGFKKLWFMKAVHYTFIEFGIGMSPSGPLWPVLVQNLPVPLWNLSSTLT
jgi:hypothetical protein